MRYHRLTFNSEMNRNWFTKVSKMPSLGLCLGKSHEVPFDHFGSQEHVAIKFETNYFKVCKNCPPCSFLLKNGQIRVRDS